MPVLGIDVSHRQGPIDWDAVSRSSVAFAYVKATEGRTLVDERFHENWEALGRVRMLRGAYHFARPASGPPEEQAEFFARTVGVGASLELPHALDLETDGGLKPDAVIDWARGFVSHVEALFKREIMIYTGRLWRETLRDPIVPELGTRMLWTARYGVQQPLVPRTWQRWDFWQFTDGVDGDVQRIPGIRGPVDAERFRGDITELRGIATPPGA